MKKTLSTRIESVEESSTLAMATKAREYISRGIDIINLSLGEPDFKTPQRICTAAKEAIDEGHYFSYPPVAGYPDLRQAIADKYATHNQVPYKSENIIVSNGAKQSIANVMFTLLNPGDEVIVFSPFWVSYSAVIQLTGAVPVMVKGLLENGFKPTGNQIKKAITSRTRAIIFSTPCNPTGSVLTRAELEMIASLVLEYKDLLVISDEIYEYINFSGEHTSIASLPGMLERTITINGFSKGFAMTGWRVGYMAAPQWIVKGAIKMQGQTTSANSSIAQRAALAAISGGLEETKKMVAQYKRRRVLVYDLLKQIPGVKITLPEGAFYFFPDVSYYYDKSNDQGPILNDQNLCMYLLDKAHVSLVPGRGFGEEKCLRLSYAASDEQLIEAMSRIKNTLSQLR